MPSLRRIKKLVMPLFWVILVVFFTGILAAKAGSLTPSATPGSTMRTLEEIFNTLAGTYDSTAQTSSINGNVSQQLKYIAGLSLQNIYNNSSTATITTTDGKNLTFSLADTTTDAKLIIDLLGTGNTFEVRDGGTAVLTIADGGQVTIAGNLDATNGLDVTGANLTVGGTKFSVDVSNGNVVSLGSVSSAGLSSSGTVNFSGLTASQAVLTDASKNLVSVATTGSGSVVLASSPTLTSPTLGAATATSVNALTLTAATTGFTIAGGTTLKTLTVSNTITFTATDGSTLAIGTGGTLGTAAYTAATAYQSTDATLTALAGLSTAQGDLVYATGSDAFSVLNKSTTANQYLKNSGTSNNPAWATIADSDLPAALTGKTYNALTLTSQATDFTIAGGTASKTLTVDSTVSISALAPLASPTFTTPSLGAATATTLGMSADLTMSGNTVNLTHSGTTSLTIASTSGTVAVESVVFTGGAISSATSLAMGGALSGVTTLAMNNQLTNTLADGTTPFVITSTTKVSNLNVDRVDDLHASAAISASGALSITANVYALHATGGTAIAISHSTADGYLHLPSGGTANQILKNSGTAGTGSWGTVTENAGALAAITTLGMSGDLTMSGNTVNLTHSGTTSLTVTSTSGTVAVEGVTFTGGALTGITSLGMGGALSGVTTLGVDSDTDFTLAGNENVTIGNTTNTLGAAGMLDLSASTATTDTRTLNLATTNTATTGNTAYSLYNALTSSAVVTGTAQNLYGAYNSVTKTGLDTSVATTTLYGVYGSASNTGATDAGTKTTYGGYFSATGDTAGTSTAYGIYATASGADTNYAGYFNGNLKAVNYINFADSVTGTFLGYQAGNVSTGVDNTAVGYQALLTNTTSTDNTAIGYLALTKATGGQNTAVGSYALATQTSSAGSTAVGYYALKANTDGSGSTAVGYYALGATTANANTGIGYSALFSDTSGTENTGMGYNAIYYNKTGSYNTVVGSGAGLGVSNQSFSNNSLFGRNSGYALTTGSNNILLGYQAADALTTGGTNIVIGYDIDLPAVSSANMLDIGNLIYATGLSSTGTTVSTGLVGIGTATPSGRLHIAQTDTSTTGTTVYNLYNALTSSAVVTGTAQNLYGDYISVTKTGLDTSAATTTLYGIYGAASNTGSTNAGTKNTYGGYFSATGDTAGTATAYGIYATVTGADTNYAGYFNGNLLAVGYIKFDNATPYGTFLGYQAGNVTTGIYNTAVGYQALLVNTTGTDNTAMGYQALSANITGSTNTAVGSNALKVNTASYNTAFGFSALMANTTGSAQVGLGRDALMSNTEGNYNTAVGNDAVMYNVTGSNNTAVGIYAGRGVLNNSFSNNSLFGYFSGSVLSTGSNNSLFGYNTGVALSTGGNNILIGYQAGDLLTTGGTNIVIGYDIDLPAVSSANMLDIGNLIFATGLTSTGTTVSTGLVGIGTATPSGRLHIAQTDTSTTGTTVYNLYNALTSSAVVTGTAQNLYGAYNAVTKTGLDTSAATTTLYGDYAAASNTGSTDAGTKNTYGGYFSATGDTNGTATAYGIYATASGADNNYAAIFNAGNVGIGTTTPSYSLQIGTGTITAGGFGGASALVKQLISDTTAGKYTQLAIQGPTDGGAAIEMYNGSGTAVADFGMNINASNLGFVNRMTSGIMEFYTHDGTSLAQRIYIGSTGNVGIGTISPGTRLDLEKAGTATADTDLLEITNSGNAASMTDTRISILFNQWYYNATTPAVADSAKITVGTEGNWTSTGTTQDAYLAFFTALDGTVGEKARITSAGLFDGIGSIRSAGSTPPASGLGLEMSYASNISYLTSYNRTTPAYLALEITGLTLALNYYSGGYVGIGTNTPAAKFTVAQDTTYVPGTVTTNGTITLTGSLTKFTDTFKVGDTITVSGETVRIIATITSDTSLTSTVAFSTSGAGKTYTLTGGTRFVVLGNGNVGIGDTTPDAAFDIDTAITSGTGFGITSTGIQLTGDLVNWTANSLTTADILDISATALNTGDVLKITASALSSGSGIIVTGPSGGTAGVTDALVKLASDVGNAGATTPLLGLISSTATIDTSGATTDTGVNLYLSTANTNSTNANTSYGIYNATTDAVALANTNYGNYTSVANTGAIDTAITKAIYGSYISASGTLGAPTTAGTTNVYGEYITTTATHAGNFGTVNQYGLYIANGTSSTNGTSTKYGIYIAEPTGADTNIPVYIPMNSITTTTAPAIRLVNETAATLNNQKHSPSLFFRGYGWETTTNSSMTTDWRMYVIPTQATTSPNSELRFDVSTNGGAWANRMYVTNAGILITPVIYATTRISSNLIQGYNETSGVWAKLNFQNAGTFATATSLVEIGGGTNVFTNSSGTAYALSLLPVYNQTSTAAATDFLINRTETAVGSGAQLLADFQVASASKFSVANTGKTTISVADAVNDNALYINTEESTTTQAVFSIETDATIADDVKFKVTADGSVYSDANVYSTPADLAEMYNDASGDLVAGEVVELVEGENFLNGDKFGVSRATQNSDNKVLGVISTKPGPVLNYDWKRQDILMQQKPVALVGRVPVKVNLEGGVIASGDPLALSAVAGVAQKAKAAGTIIGYALEPYIGATDENKGQVLVFIQPGVWFPTDFFDTINNPPSSDSGLSFGAVLSGLRDLGLAIEDGLVRVKNLIAETITAKKLCLGETCMTEAELKVLLENANQAPAVAPAAAPVVETPPVEQPPVEEPLVETPPVVETPLAETPTAQPLVVEPLPSEPVAETPPVEQPPVEQPPAEEPPAEEPPAVETPPVDTTTPPAETTP